MYVSLKGVGYVHKLCILIYDIPVGYFNYLTVSEQ